MGVAIYQSMNAHYGALPLAQQTLIRKLFTTGDHTGFGISPQDALPAIQAWLEKDLDLRTRIYKMPGHLLATAFAPLLVWSLNQDWSREDAIPVVLRKWLFLIKDGHSLPAHLVSASVFLHTLVPTLDCLPPQPIARLAAEIYDAMDQASPSDAQPGVRASNDTILASTDIVVGLGHIAARAPQDEGRDGIALQTLWESRLDPLWDSMTYSQNLNSICHLLDSSLPDQQKWRAMSYTSWGFLQNERIQSKIAMLTSPTTEFEYGLVLPWSTVDDDGDSTTMAMRGKAIMDNKEMLAHFCPTLERHIVLLASDNDWASKPAMLQWLEMAKPRPIAETLPLPVGYSP